jgi:hypothetical protein
VRESFGMPKAPAESSFLSDVRWILRERECAVAAVCSRCGMELAMFWNQPRRGFAVKVEIDFVEQHAKRCLARPFPSSLDFEAGAP